MPTIFENWESSAVRQRATVSRCRERILVVDDDPSLREVATWGLRLSGYESEAARDGIEAMEWIGREPFDLILLDLLMPVVGGLRFLEWLRQERSIDMPVIVYTGQRDPALTQRVQQAGATRLLWKPLRLEQILETVQSVLHA